MDEVVMVWYGRYGMVWFLHALSRVSLDSLNLKLMAPHTDRLCFPLAIANVSAYVRVPRGGCLSFPGKKPCCHSLSSYFYALSDHFSLLLFVSGITRGHSR